MSLSSGETPNGQPQNRFSFQHFDQECDFGIENAEGERVRKRKKPGRKPNPPTLQERRAQNRAAQKAFREREQQRREEKERQWRDYNEEIKSIKKQLAAVQYEAKYLKACVLHLTLACLIHRGSVPHIWTESRIIPSNSHGEYKKPVFAPYGQNIINEAYQTPALLDMLLENHYIVDFDKAVASSLQQNAFTNYKKRCGADPDLSFSAYKAYISQDVILMNRSSQELKRSFPRAKKRRPSSNAALSQLSSTQTSELIPPSLPLQSQKAPTPTSAPVSENLPFSPPSQASNNNNNYNNNDYSTNGSYNSNSQVLTVPKKPVLGVIYEPPSLKTSEDFVNMPALQALHILRLQLKLGSILGNMTAATLLPTALQRVIPHDIRIDYVPGAAIRDRLIIFQDYYNMDDCFTFLTQNTIFIGGDVRDKRNWVVRPEYSMKFWFLSHHLVDNSYDDTIAMQDVDIINEEYMKNGNDSSDTEEETSMPQKQQSKKKQHIPNITQDTSGLNMDSSHIQNVYFREI